MKVFTEIRVIGVTKQGDVIVSKTFEYPMLKLNKDHIVSIEHYSDSFIENASKIRTVLGDTFVVKS